MQHGYNKTYSQSLELAFYQNEKNYYRLHGSTPKFMSRTIETGNDERRAKQKKLSTLRGF